MKKQFVMAGKGLLDQLGTLSAPSSYYTTDYAVASSDCISTSSAKPPKETFTGEILQLCEITPPDKDGYFSIWTKVSCYMATKEVEGAAIYIPNENKEWSFISKCVYYNNYYYILIKTKTGIKINDCFILLNRHDDGYSNEELIEGIDAINAVAHFAPINSGEISPTSNKNKYDRAFSNY